MEARRHQGRIQRRAEGCQGAAHAASPPMGSDKTEPGTRPTEPGTRPARGATLWTTPWEPSRSPILGPMRLTTFWNNMHEQFGEVYADSLAKDYVIEGLGSRTVNQALAEGVGAKEVWRAVCEAFDLPATVR